MRSSVDRGDAKTGGRRVIVIARAKLFAARFYTDHVHSRSRGPCHAVVHGADALAIDDDQL
jgi:hypothetical protein